MLLSYHMPGAVAKISQYDFIKTERHEKALLAFIQCLIANNGNLELTKTTFTEERKLSVLIGKRNIGTFLAAAEAKYNDLKGNRNAAALTVSKAILEKFDELQEKLAHTSITIDSNTCVSPTSTNPQAAVETLRNILKQRGFIGEGVIVEIYSTKGRQFLAKGAIDPQLITYVRNRPSVALYCDANNPKYINHTNVIIVKSS